MTNKQDLEALLAEYQEQLRAYEADCNPSIIDDCEIEIANLKDQIEKLDK